MPVKKKVSAVSGDLSITNDLESINTSAFHQNDVKTTDNLIPDDILTLLEKYEAKNTPASTVPQEVDDSGAPVS